MADILLAIPDLIDHIHSCVQFAQKYARIGESFASDIDHVERVSKTVTIMTELMRQNNFLQAEDEIMRSLKKLEKALFDLYVKFDKWRNVMNSEDRHSSCSFPLLANLDAKEEKSNALDLSGSADVALEDKEGTEANCSLRRGLLGLKWLKSKLTISLRWKRRRDGKGCTVQSGKDVPQTTVETHPERNLLVTVARRAHYLTLVDPAIKDSLKVIDRTIEDLFRFFNLSMMFSRSIYNSEAREFVEKARQRIAAKRPVQHLDIPSTSLVPLDHAFAESSEFPQSLFYVDRGEYGECLVDRRFVRHLVNKGREQETVAETEQVARMMAEDPQDKKGISSSNVPILRSCGVAFPHSFGDIHDVVFRLPRGHHVPQTLRKALVAHGPAPNLRTRATVAFHLATALDIVHRLDVVHKRVRPESIILLRQIDDKGLASDGYSPSLGMPFLAGFTYSRREVSDSSMTPIYGSEIPELIYHHPRHIEASRRQAYQSHDDIYSLGICLLEIGLWKSIVSWDEAKSQYRLNEYWKLDTMDYVLPDLTLPSRLWFRRRGDIIRLAERELPQSMGPAFADIVVACLEFAERNEKAKATGDGPEVPGVNFSLDVVSKLYELKF